jgi:predicted MFS family arabinose efflux permease
MPWSFVLSAVLFGGTFLAVINVMTLQIRAAIPPERWATVVGNATALFALGQLVGPTLTGIIADLRGGLALGLMASAATLALGGIVALCGSDQGRS